MANLVRLESQARLNPSEIYAHEDATMLCRFDEYRSVSGVWPGDNLNLCSPFEPFRCVYRFASHR